MILTCPSCSAKFMISSDAFGKEGREVRCGKCSHMWFQPGERDSLDELPPAEPEENIDIGFVNHVDPQESIPQALKPKISSEAVVTKKAQTSSRKIIAVMAALILATLAFLGFISMRDSLGNKFPLLGAAYEKMGFHLDKADPEIAIDRLKLSKNGDKLTGTMFLINLTSHAVPVKKIVAEQIDLDEKVLNSLNIKVTDAIIKDEGQSKVDFVFDTVAKGTVSVRIKIPQN